MLPFDHSQFGVALDVDILLADIGGVLRAMKHQGPLKQHAVLGLVRVKDDK